MRNRPVPCLCCKTAIGLELKMDIRFAVQACNTSRVAQCIMVYHADGPASLGRRYLAI